jgi:hypothetical protein
VNLLSDNTHTVKKNTEALFDASKVVGLEVNRQTKYVLLSRHQNGGQNQDIQIANRCSENVAQLTFLGMAMTNQNLILEETKRRLNSGNACCHSVQNLLSSHLLSKSKKVKLSLLQAVEAYRLVRC